MTGTDRIDEAPVTPRDAGAAWPPPDSELPGLGIALDTERMAETFCRYLSKTPGPTFDVKECQLTRIRYREGTRAVLQYSLALVNVRTSESSRQVVTGTLYPGNRPSDLARKLRKQGLCRDLGFGPFQPVCHIAEANMLVQAFPFDRRLPSLAKLAAVPPEELRRVIQTELGAGQSLLGPCRAQTVRYRAGLSAVIRYDIPATQMKSSESRQLCYYAKINRRTEQTVRGWRQLNALQAQRLPFETVRPLAYLPDQGALLLESANGMTLEEVLLREDGDAQMRRLARALAEFHQCNIVPLQRHSESDRASRIHRAASRIRWACPELAKTVDRLAGKALGIPEASLCPTHGDLKPEHVFFQAHRIALIDWDDFALADPVLDAATLLARIAAMGLRYQLPVERLAQVSTVFVDEYFSSVPSGWQNRLPGHYAGAAIEVAAGFFGRQEPHWRDATAYLVNAAARYPTELVFG